MATLPPLAPLHLSLNERASRRPCQIMELGEAGGEAKALFEVFGVFLC